MDKINKIAYNKSIELLLKASTPKGFLASVNEIDNYTRIWNRDSAICGIAALLSKDEKLISTFLKSIETIFEFQHKDGFLPSNVNPSNNSVSYGGSVGRADLNSWGVISLCLFAKNTNNSEILKKHENAVNLCFSVIDSWEFNGKHLMYVPQSSSWADEYFMHGYLLFENLLRLWAMELAADCYNNDKLKLKATKIRKTIEDNFWSSRLPETAVYSNIINKQKHNFPQSLWCAGFNPGRVYAQIDLQAQALSLILNLGSKEQQLDVANTLYNNFKKSNGMLPSFYPTITEKDDDYNELSNIFEFKFRNLPNEFHNGGLWPVWNGFLALAVYKLNPNFTNELLIEINKANQLSVIQNNEWEFNECLHGANQKPIGVPNCSWSAAANIMAQQTLLNINIF